MSRTFVVVGGDAAGMSAASKARREDPDLDVIVFERGDWVSYGACGLPYYLKGEVESLEDLVAVPPERFREERGIDLRTRHEVVDVDPERSVVTVSDRDADRQFDQSYDRLLLSTGARAVEPPFEGMALDGVFTLHGMDAAAEIASYLGIEGPDEESPLEAVAIVGGGYVGIEVAEALRARGLEVHLFEMLSHVLNPFGEAVAERVEEELRAEGVRLHLDTAVESFRSGGDADGGRVEGVVAGDETVPVDAVIVGVGVEPNVELAERAGIDLGDTGAVATDHYGRTSEPGVYAAGDVAELRNVVTGRPDHVPLALSANRAGRAIGATVGGTPTPVGETAGTAVVKAFGLEAARTGLVDEASAREAGFEPASVTIQAPSRAHYYPGGDELTVTLVADRGTRRVLGGTMVGREGVAKRIDTVATALHAGMTVEEVEYLDLSYAPPFSPVWDPVLTAAKVLSGKLE